MYTIIHQQTQQIFLWTVVSRKEGNVLFNDALNTFHLWLYGIIHMVKDHSDSERGNPLLPHGLFFLISSKSSFICITPHRQDNTYHCLCYTSHGAHAGTKNSSMGPPWRIDPMTHRIMSERSYISLPCYFNVRYTVGRKCLIGINPKPNRLLTSKPIK